VSRHFTAILLWILAWFFAGLIPAGFFAARNGKRDVALAELAIGAGGAGCLALAGAALW
jgi:hypothetical protein